MPLPIGGEISAGQINNEFGRGFSSYFEIWQARNGGYGGVNGCSGMRPGAPGRNTNSGYAWSDWWGYDHGYSCANIYSYVIESACDADVRVQRRWHEGSWIGEWWNWSTAYVYHTNAQKFDQVNAWFDANIDWGNFWCWCTKRVYSNYRGFFLDCSGNQNAGCDLFFQPLFTGEYFEVQNFCQ